MIEQIKMLRRVVVIWLSLLTLMLLTGGIYEDYRSCQRQVPVREASADRVAQLKRAWTSDAERAKRYARIDTDPVGAKVNSDYARTRRQLLAEIRPVAPIDCSTFPPGR